MALLCNHCWDIHSLYGFEHTQCRCGGDIVHIDDQMVTIVRNLNEKGYKTQYCCAGHDYEQHVTSPYVQILLSQSYNVDIAECTGTEVVTTATGDIINYHRLNDTVEIEQMIDHIGSNVKDVHDYLMRQDINTHHMYSLFGNVGYRLIIRMLPIPESNDSIKNVSAINRRIEDMLNLVMGLPDVGIK